jgi:hypothetical protein
MGCPPWSNVPCGSVVHKLAVRGALLKATIISSPWVLAQGPPIPPETDTEEPGPPRLQTPALPREQTPRHLHS